MNIRSAADQSRMLATFARLLKKEKSNLKDVIKEFHPADIHEIFTLLSHEEQGKMLMTLPPPIAAKILAYFDEICAKK